MNASELSIGSVVADGEVAWIKRHPNHWDGTWIWNESDDDEIDGEIARGAKVLRVGYEK